MHLSTCKPIHPVTPLRHSCKDCETKHYLLFNARQYSMSERYNTVLAPHRGHLLKHCVHRGVQYKPQQHEPQHWLAATPNLPISAQFVSCFRLRIPLTMTTFFRTLTCHPTLDASSYLAFCKFHSCQPTHFDSITFSEQQWMALAALETAPHSNFTAGRCRRGARPAVN